jgi:hypothetical protein
MGHGRSPATTWLGTDGADGGNGTVAAYLVQLPSTETSSLPTW